MRSDLSRRNIMQAIGATALSTQTAPGAQIPEPRAEARDTPKICLESGAGSLSAGHLDAAGMRRVKQLGVDHVLMGGPKIPWEESQIRSIMDNIKSGGLTLGNMMIGGFPNAIYGRPGRDEEIEKVRQSIRAAGRAGLWRASSIAPAVCASNSIAALSTSPAA